MLSLFKKSSLKFLTLLIFVFVFSNIAIAAPPGQTDEAGCKTDANGNIVCPIENPINLPDKNTDVANIINLIIKSALGIIGAITLFMFVWGGFQWLISAGNAERVKSGLNTMKWAAIGLVLVFFSYVIVKVLMDYLTGSA